MTEDQAAAVQAITERNDEDQPEGIANLCHRDDDAGGSVIDPKLVRNHVEHRLGIGDAGDGQPAGDGTQEQHRPW